MKIINYKSMFFSGKLLLIALLSLITLQSCNEDELPGEGSIADVTPPNANFSFKINVADYKTVDYTNLSSSATTYLWDFGDGTTSTDKNNSHSYQEIGTYAVTLTASDKLGAVSTNVQEVTIVEKEIIFEPEILNPGFEEGTAFWANPTLGGIVQTSTSPVFGGKIAGKLPADGSRCAYQLITVEKNKKYVLSFYYTIKSSPPGSLTVKVLAGAVETVDQVAAATIVSKELTDQENSNTYALASVTFNSGDSTAIAIYLTNTGADCRFDNFTIVSE